MPVCRITHHDNDFGVLLDNDALIADALGVLSRRGSNRQIPLPFLLPVIRYEIDVVEVAAQAVRLLVDTLLAGSPATGCIRYPFTRIEPDDMLV